MSKVMLLGVLRIPRPTDPKDLSLMDWMQFDARMKEAADELETAWAERDAAIARTGVAEKAFECAIAERNEIQGERDAARALADKLAEALGAVAVTSSCEIALEVVRAALAEYDAAREKEAAE